MTVRPWPRSKINHRAFVRRLLIASATMIVGVATIFSLVRVAAIPDAAEARQCLPGQGYCPTSPTSRVCDGDCYGNQRCVAEPFETVGTLVPDSTCSGSTTLTISNVSHGTPGSDRATITWTTNLAASTELRYGLTSFLGSTQVNTVPSSTSHSVTITGLQPSTTYYYQAYSETGPDPDDLRATSSLRNFTTSSGALGGTLPTIVLGPEERVNIDTARITFKTNVPTAALIEFSTEPNTQPDSGNPGYSQVCDASANCSSPPPQPNVLNIDHTINLTGLSQPSSPYFYRITIIDANRNVFALPDRFTTTASSNDYIFSTGDCDDGTPLRQCNADKKFCRPGNRDPVFDCRPNIACPYTCPGGSTCAESGDCIQDPALGTSPTECNPKSCYLKCDGNSGSFSGRRCGIDADCNGGKCIVGSFTTPAGPGCYASWPSCDANVILKVRPDRVCDKWLTCKTSLPVTNAQGQTQNQCLDLTICDSLTPNGQCNNVLEGRQCDNDPLRFCADDADCPGGRCSLANEPRALTFRTPEEVSQISGLTGYSVAGLDWHGQPNSLKIDGYYPLSVAKQVGTRFDIPNSNFEDSVVVQRCQNPITKSCTQDNDCTPSKCIFLSSLSHPNVRNILVAEHWEPVNPVGSTKNAAVTLDSETSKTSPNHMLKITPSNLADSGAQTSAGVELRTSAQAEYLLSFRIRSEQNEQPVTVSLVNPTTGDRQVLGDLFLTTGWQALLLGPKAGVNGDTRIAFTTPVTGEPVSFWIDDVAMLPALKVSDTKYVPQSCRLYPSDGAPTCDFTDRNGLLFKGLKGYCLERDSLNSAICLSWWPVDAVFGDSVFGAADQEAGYRDRQPLYACAEAVGQSSSFNTGATIFTGVDCDADTAGPVIALYPGGSGGLCNEQLGPYRPMTTKFPATADAIKLYGQNFGGPCNTIEDRAECRDGTQPGFCFCSKLGYDSGLTTPSATDQKIHKYDVEYFRVHMMRYNQNGDSTWDRIVPIAGDIILNEGNGWFARAGADASNCAGMWFELKWDSVDQHLTGINWGAQRCANSNEAASGFWAQGLFFMKERCTKLVQVATDDSVTAWADRTSNAATYVVPDLNYRYVNDLAPFGTAAPRTVEEPDDWNKFEPLTVQGPDVSRPSPNQVRAGSAYACKGNCSGRVCSNLSGRQAGQFCLDSSDCFDDNGTPKDSTDDRQGTCEGNGFCATYDAGTKTYDFDQETAKACTRGYSTGTRCDANSSVNKGATCTADADCQFTTGRCVNLPGQLRGKCDGNSGSKSSSSCFNDSECRDTAGRCVTGVCPAGQQCCSQPNEECIGGAASNRGTQTLNSSVPTLASGSYAQYNLMRLFAKTYGLWEWNITSGKYEQQTSFSSWNPPTTLCKVCSGGADANKACTADGDCTGGTCVDAVRHSSEAVTSEPTADYCAIKPTITNISNRDVASVVLDEGVTYTLRFNSNVDLEQRPLTEVAIDWGDGDTTVDGNLRIAPRDDPNRPHAYTHVYHCGRKGICNYQVKVRIRDNWGWCDNGVASTPCKPTVGTSTADWQNGPLIQVVR
ncbi:MAG: fibronectin type III domain-containing protein [Candidatus Kerfeldbacteria bacterium]|nr:fibronectin type III domain-containing protein [Candidatus Kerfeldbacteria bacterium]